ncbi:uncharacterized protein AMSG_00079 [Thecamonas trahens ATCC 50062]|uniref:Uncharacterized protein n=1 Tax=Thecamonas trahens ATCC 50062 TaxID=461836 RepID=A0A0L0D0R3_THETB|nr:hypothetical protein AMSG_00079 [Thecamonas trahens ATCC 50062]KNC45964.1 hypothetical protein AMSG_00079 [Thecamonas trahens ATCC 50062]|eukprot:XP_013762945.1 hypothetical protein AMSG_00079 [Thecamonas trahens ATCC 50062]
MPDFRPHIACSRVAPRMRELERDVVCEVPPRRESSPDSIDSLYSPRDLIDDIQCARVEPNFDYSSDSELIAAPSQPSWWDDTIKEPSPACLGLPGSSVPSLAKLCIKTMLDEGVYFRDEPQVVAQVEAEMRSFPFLNLKDPRPADEWPAATLEALRQPLESDACVPAINVAVDLEDTAGRIYDLVTMVDSCEQLADRANIPHAFERYARYLDLVRAHPEVQLVPALDILAVWYAHLIRTGQYKTFCLSRYPNVGERRRLVDRTGPLIVLDTYGKLLTNDDDHQVAEALAVTGRLWMEAYGEPYQVNLAEVYPATPQLSLTPPVQLSMSVDDFLHDRDWLTDLHSMISAEQRELLALHSTPYLRSLIRSYERFLYLNAKHSTGYLSVALDVDLIWHAHQIYPANYEMDCLRMFGQPVPHIPWPEHTPEEDAANTAHLESVWAETFGLDFGARPTLS